MCCGRTAERARVEERREGKGDLEGAKKAYQVVVNRWGDAKPKSRTAEEAKKRLKQLE